MEEVEEGDKSNHLPTLMHLYLPPHSKCCWVLIKACLTIFFWSLGFLFEYPPSLTLLPPICLSCVLFKPCLFSHWFPSSHTTFFLCLSSFSLHFPDDFVLFTFHCFFQSNPLLSSLISPLLSLLTISSHPTCLFPSFSSSHVCFSFTSAPLRLPPRRAAVPGRSSPVQAAAGSWGWVLLRELPVGPSQPRLCSHWGGAPTRRWGHCRGVWEITLPNGGYVWKLFRE